MNDMAWHTTEDVLNDLEVALGFESKDVNEIFILRGEKPPPPPRHIEDEDEEVQLRYGHCVDRLPVDGSVKPDLDGITKFIRMVEKEKSSKENLDTISGQPTAHNIVISKLNPFVEEFVPRSAKTGLLSPVASETNSNKTNNRQIGIKSATKNKSPKKYLYKEKLEMEPSVEEKVKETSKNGLNNVIKDKTTVHNLKSPKKYLNEERFKIESLLEEKVKETSKNGFKNITKDKTTPDNVNSSKKYLNGEKLRIGAILKEKIKESAKGYTIKDKRDRNVAIAALMKLNTAPFSTASPRLMSSNSNSPQTASASTSPDPLVLFPPEYFEVPRCPATKVNIDDTEHSIPQPPQSEKSDSGSSFSDSSSEDSAESDVKIENTVTSNKVLELIDPEVEESIKKVNNWFEKPKLKPKPIVPQMGAIIYKKKERAPSVSGINSPSDSVEAVLHVTPSFVPSAYASNLAKTYEERSKAKAAQLDIWTKLERDLKAKDEEIRKRLREPQDEILNSSSSSSQASSRRQNHSRR